MAKTLKVRIPAVISPDGKWCAYGYPSAQTDPDWSMVEEVADNGEQTCEFKRIYITAELPIPETEEIEALAINADDLCRKGE